MNKLSYAETNFTSLTSNASISISVLSSVPLEEKQYEKEVAIALCRMMARLQKNNYNGKTIKQATRMY